MTWTGSSLKNVRRLMSPEKNLVLRQNAWRMLVQPWLCHMERVVVGFLYSIVVALKGLARNYLQHVVQVYYIGSCFGFAVCLFVACMFWGKWDHVSLIDLDCSNFADWD